MLYSPFQFLHRDQDFSKRGIDFRFARIQACRRGNSFLIVKNVSKQGECDSFVASEALMENSYLSNVFNTCRRCLHVVLAHALWASCAFVTALSIPPGVAGFTRPRKRPLAGQ